MVKLGDKVKDPVTGFKGIAYCRTVYLQGCDRIGIQAPAYKDRDGAVLVQELFYVDEPQLEIVTPVKKPKKKATTGGPSGFGPSGKQKI